MGRKALQLAKTIYNIPDNVEEVSDVVLPYNYARIYYNHADLTKRRTNFGQLKMQIDRFNDDF